MKKILFILIFSFTSLSLFSQSSSFIFHNSRVKEGLSFNFCFSLLRDSRGMMWVGTHSGLNRFDGQHFYQFNAGQDSNSFINNSILDLCEDKKGDIWGATASGIFRYDGAENKFENYIPPGYDYARAVHNIICDKQGDIWATGLWTILKLNRQNNQFEEIGPLTNNKDSLGLYSVRQNGMIEDPSGKGIWMATRNGLYYYNTAENKFYNFSNSPGDPAFTSHSVAALSLSGFGYLWYFDNISKEIIAIDVGTHQVLHRISTVGIIDNAIGQTLFEDSNHQLWFSTWNNKMVVIDYRKNIVTPIAYNNDNPLSIPGDNFWGIWEDEDRTIWLGTEGGLARCNYSKSVYSIYPVADRVKEFSEGHIGILSIDPRDESWWIACDAPKSVVRYYPENGQYQFYDFAKAVKNQAGQLPGYVQDIRVTASETFFFTTNGIWKLGDGSGIVHPFEKKFKTISDVSFNYFKEDGNNQWFFTTKGFIRVNKLTGEEKLIKSDIDMLPDSQRVKYGDLFTDSRGLKWFVPAFGWLGCINDKDEISLKFYIKDKPKELAAYLIAIREDSKGILWLGSVGAGLYRYDVVNDDFRLLSRAEGIGSLVRDMIIDKEDRIWMVSYNSFSVYEPATGSISQYHLPVNENTLNYHNMFRVTSGNEILATLNRDIVKFIPSRLNVKPGIIAPLISAIKISGKDKLITGETGLNLEPNENSLEFSFGSLIDNEVFPYTLQYRLDGFDKEWILATGTAKALYSNLSPGKYKFRVKAVSKNGNWSTTERTMSIRIKTPFYKAGWFWIMISALLIGSLIFFYRFRLNKQKQILTLETKAQQLEKEKTVVMYDSLKQQLNPHFLFNSLTSLSGLIATDQEMAGEFLDQMSGIYRYILKNGDNETVALKDEISFVKLYIELQQTRFKKGLEVHIDVPEEYLHFKIAPVTLQNLIENAIKHNIIDAGSPLVVTIFIEEEYLVVKNNLQLKSSVETSNKKGLAQFITLYGYLSEKPVQIKETEKSFSVKIPLI